MKALRLALVALVSLSAASLADEKFSYAMLNTGYPEPARNLKLVPTTKGKGAGLELTGFAVFDSKGRKVQEIVHSYIQHRQPHSFVDFDFDGHLDIMIDTLESSHPNMCYEFWRFDPKTGRFAKDDRLEGIDWIDEDAEELSSSGRSGATQSHNTYKWKGDLLVPVREYSINQNREGELTSEKCFYENGMLRKRITGPDDREPQALEHPYRVTVERFDPKGKLTGKTVQVRHKTR